MGSPIPRHRPGEQNRSAAIVMSYFHPWTLRSKDAEQHVPYAGELRKPEETWQEALQFWLEGNVLCHESAKYINNFMSVHRVRPGDDETDDCNSDDIISDEEL